MEDLFVNFVQHEFDKIETLDFEEDIYVFDFLWKFQFL